MKRVPSTYIVNPARDDPDQLCLRNLSRPSAIGEMYSLKYTPVSEPADLIFFGFVASSDLISGRAYMTGSGKARLVKEVEIVLVAQEGQRAMAMLSMAADRKTWQVPVTENGGVMFSTKHTVINDNDNVPKKSAWLSSYMAYPADTAYTETATSGSSIKKPSKGPSASHNQTPPNVHPDIRPRVREGTDNSTWYACPSQISL